MNLSLSAGRRNRSVGISSAIVLPLAALLGLAAQADASTMTRDSSVRQCVSTSAWCSAAKRLGTFTRGTTVSMRCWHDGRTETGVYSSNRWFLVRRSKDGYEGFVHSSHVGGQTKVGWCGDSLRVKAGMQAAARLGQTKPSSSDVKLGGWTTSSFGRYGDWSGDCIKLAWVAYRRAGKSLGRGDAYAAVKKIYDSSALHSERGRTTLPRYGALVTWQSTKSNRYGHASVSIGGTRTASTIGYDRDQKPNGYVATTGPYGGPYFGWVVPK